MIEKLQITKDEIKKLITGKKIAAIDYGKKRIGIAVTDIFHITLNPLVTLENSGDKVLLELQKIFKSNSIDIVLMGFPLRIGNLVSEIHNEIIELSDKIENSTGLKVLLYDESNTSKKASDNLIIAGVKKSDRKAKGTLDRFAAMNILKNFLEEIEG